MTLPFQPEPESVLCKRWLAAMEPVFQTVEILGGGGRPGQDRRHVFDFEDGTRLIASREENDSQVFLHVSASAIVKPENFDTYLFGKCIAEKVKRLNGNGIIEMLSVFETPGGVVHIVLRDPPLLLRGTPIPANIKSN